MSLNKSRVCTTGMGYIIIPTHLSSSFPSLPHPSPSFLPYSGLYALFDTLWHNIKMRQIGTGYSIGESVFVMAVMVHGLSDSGWSWGKVVLHIPGDLLRQQCPDINQFIVFIAWMPPQPLEVIGICERGWRCGFMTRSTRRDSLQCTKRMQHSAATYMTQDDVILFENLMARACVLS